MLVVDDHPVVREGLRAMLDAEPDLEVVGEAAYGAEAVALAARLRPDVVLMDLRMPGTDGVTATGRIAADRPTSRVLVSPRTTPTPTSCGRSRPARPATCSRTRRGAELADAVRAAARGETVLAPPVARKLVSRMRLPAVESPTPRELEVLAQVARGLSNVDIGRELHISEATVKTHLVRVFDKLGVYDRTAAVTKAIGQGLLPPP